MFLGFQSKWSQFLTRSLSCLSLPALQGTTHLSFKFDCWVNGFSKAFQNFTMHKWSLAASKDPWGNNLPTSLCCFFMSLTQETQLSQHPEVQCLLSLINWVIALCWGFMAGKLLPGRKPRQMWNCAFSLLRNTVLSYIALCLKTVISYILFSNMTIFKWKVESCYSAPTRIVLTNDVESF